MAFSGANPEQLEAAAGRIREQSRGITGSARRLRTSVNTSPWHGRSADQFRSDFNSHYYRSLVNAAAFLESAEAELRRNAREQTEVSSVSGSVRVPWFRFPKWPPCFPVDPRFRFPKLPRLPSWGWPNWKFPWSPGFRFPALPFPLFPGLPKFELPGFWVPRDVLIGLGLLGAAAAPGSKGGSKPGAQTPAPRPAAPPAPPAPKAGDSSGVLSPAGRSIEEAKNIHDKMYPPGTKDPGEAYQCVAWAQARWNQLEVPTNKIGVGNGWELAAKSGGVLGGDPTLGAMVSMGGPPYGHVAIVEEIIRSDGQVRVRISEMNTGSDGSGWDIGNPREYKDSVEMVRNADNTWMYNGVNQGKVTFAALPPK